MFYDYRLKESKRMRYEGREIVGIDDGFMIGKVLKLFVRDSLKIFR
jgi:hypothetical protein